MERSPEPCECTFTGLLSGQKKISVPERLRSSPLRVFLLHHWVSLWFSISILSTLTGQENEICTYVWISCLFFFFFKLYFQFWTTFLPTGHLHYLTVNLQWERFLDQGINTWWKGGRKSLLSHSPKTDCQQITRKATLVTVPWLLDTGTSHLLVR